MKKLLAAGCCILAFQSLSQVAQNNDLVDTNGKRMLVKAIAVVMNAEGQRKMPPKHIYPPNLESPRV
jgi:hypothetical protein